MHSEPGSHPLLAQVPLAVSPLVSLPTSTTLPYTYRKLPSTLPPSTAVTATTSAASEGYNKPRFIVSASGHAVHPDDILASCATLQTHLNKLEDDAEQELKAWMHAIADRELAEKRRVAPGWLDSEAKILEPERKVTSQPNQTQESKGSPHILAGEAPSHFAVNLNEGEQLDRVFGVPNAQ